MVAYIIEHMQKHNLKEQEVTMLVSQNNQWLRTVRYHCCRMLGCIRFLPPELVQDYYPISSASTFYFKSR